MLSLLFFSFLGLRAQGCFVPSVHPAILNIGQSATYAVYGTGNGSYSWSVSSGLSILSGQGTNTVVVKNNSACSGTVRVSRFGNSPCRATQNITSNTPGCVTPPGPPAVPAFVNVLYELCFTVIVDIAAVAGATGYKVYVDGVLLAQESFTTITIDNIYLGTQQNIWLANPGIHTVCVKAYNSHGESASICGTYNGSDPCGKWVQFNR